jgi:hypothetical protein
MKKIIDWNKPILAKAIRLKWEELRKGINRDWFKEVRIKIVKNEAKRS